MCVCVCVCVCACVRACVRACYLDGLNGSRSSSSLYNLHGNHGREVRVQEHGQQHHHKTRVTQTICTTAEIYKHGVDDMCSRELFG